MVNFVFSVNVVWNGKFLIFNFFFVSKEVFMDGNKINVVENLDIKIEYD